MNILLVALGGAIGAAARYQAAVWIRDLLGNPDFPWWTFIVNISGSFLIGIAFGLMKEAAFAIDKTWLFLAVGALGGYTTFSTFTLETLQLVAAGNFGVALLNLLTGPVGLIAIYVGVIIVRGPQGMGGTI